MLSLNPIDAELEAYDGAIKVVVALTLVCATALWITILTHQRNTARAEVAAQALTIKGYQLASQTAQAVANAHTAQAQAVGQQVAQVVQDLAKATPKTDDEARQWAIQAAGRIK